MTFKPPENEWHRDPKVGKRLDQLIKIAYGAKLSYGDGHHVSVQLCKPGKRPDTIKEWASVETMIFDPWFLTQIAGERWIEVGQSLVAFDNLGRLDELLRVAKRRERSEKANQKVSRPAASVSRRNRK